MIWVTATYNKFQISFNLKHLSLTNRRIIQFDINNMTIQENTDYREVASTIQTSNKYIVLDEDIYLS